MNSVRILLISCLLIFTNTWAQVTALVNTDHLIEGETLILAISADQLIGSFDLTPLEKDFDIVGRHQSFNINIINRNIQKQVTWQFVLRPKHGGDIIIPSLAVGSDRTPSSIIHVAAAAPTTTKAKSQSKRILIEAFITPKEVFPQEQIIYTVKLYYDQQIANPSLIPPNLANAEIKDGQEIHYEGVKNGRRYQVMEHSYLIIPAASGHFKITPFMLRGSIEEMGTDMFGFAMQRYRPINVAGPTLEINVKPILKNFTDPWFPAQKVTLSESWEPEVLSFREGEPITRVVQVNAIGASGDQIPGLTINSSPNINHYPQQPVRETNINYNVQVGKLTQKITFIATKVGQVTFPAIQLRWFNSQTQREEIARLPEKTVEIAPALTSPPITKGAQIGTTASPADIPKKENSIWLWVAIFFLFAWLTTVLLWRRQNRPGKVKVDSNDILKQLQQACTLNDSKLTRQYFLEWAQLHWKELHLQSLAEVIPYLATSEGQPLQAEIMKLEATFYSKKHIHWDGVSFWGVFNHYLATLKNVAPSQIDPLPPLYIDQ